MKIIALLFLLSLVFLLAAGTHVDLSLKYPFKTSVFDDQGQSYELYWNYSIAAGTIHFAVNVSTTGWVGFGVSPNGQMPGSDVVIGWIAADGKMYFHDRYAEGRRLPPIDESQDWCLSFGEEEEGFTILEFSRKLSTCDSRDLEIGTGTARVVWSFSTSDPSDPLGESARFHDFQGSLSLNLLGGFTNPPSDPDDVQSFDLTVSNVIIPSADTTYWCQSFELPEEVRSTTRYISRVSPVITPHARAFVHHILIYLCSSPLNNSLIGESGPCNTVTRDIRVCRQGFLISGWAIGGEDIIYPENVALPVGGPGVPHHAVMEMHYDNPNMQEGVMDSSGMRFYYSSIPKEHDAGIIFLGHAVTPFMIIPPGAPNYTIGAVCPANCTRSYLPDGGIRIFANLLHTHLVGRALELQHLRWNSECEVYEELPPIDLNPNYDFNFQQYTYLPNEVTVLPGDILILKCYYNTSKNSDVTIGGESTREEMCLSFPIFYPSLSDRYNLDYCVGFPNYPSTFVPFTTKYFPLNPKAARLFNEGQAIGSFNAINWTSGTVQDLENIVLTGPKQTYCSSSSSEDNGLVVSFDGIPEASCPYEAPDKCNSYCFEPQSCCQKLEAGENAVKSPVCPAMKPTGCPVTAGIMPLVMQLDSLVVMCSALISILLSAACY